MRSIPSAACAAALALSFLVNGARAEETQQNHRGSAIQSDSLELDAGTLSGTMSVVIDDTVSEALIMVTSSSKTLTVSVTDPSSNETFVGGTGPGVIGSLTYPDTADIDPLIEGKDYVFKLESPAPGTWTVNVTETVTLTGPLPVVTNVWLGSPIQAFMVGGEEDYPVGSEIRLGVFVMDDTQSLSGYTASGITFRSMDATFTPVAFSPVDDGVAPDFVVDGLATDAVVIGEAGVYDARVTIEGMTTGGQPYRRDVFTQFRVIAPTATLVDGTVTDTSTDVDGDSLIESITISNDVGATEAGDYIVQVTLRTGGGTEVSRATMVALPVGTSTVGVDFDVDALKELGEDGPYSITKIVLQRAYLEDEQVQDVLLDVGTTAAYLLASLERDPIVVADFIETPNDCDGDGDFDSLALDVVIDVLTAGTYQYSMSLTDGDGNEIDFLSGVTFFAVGPNTLSFDFDAYLITARGGDGPYSLSSALIFSAVDVLVAGTLGSTAPYTEDQFQPVPTTFPLVEDFELLAPGPIATQGWGITAGTDPASAIVGGTAPLSGTQALELVRDAALGDAMTWGAFSPLVPADDVEQVVDVALRIAGMGGPTYDVIVQSPTDGFAVAWVRFANDGDVLVYQPWAGSFAHVSTGYDWLANVGAGNYLSLQILVSELEIAASRVTISIEGTKIFNGPTLGSTFVEQVVFATDNTGPDTGLIVDDLSVTNRFMRVDCNFNGQPDACDIGSGSSTDCDANGIPDECDLAAGAPDCNANGLPDSCDFASGQSLDCNANGIPDECDIASGLEVDCNGNGVPDDCDLANGTSLDCNANGVPDECDVAAGTSLDCNANGLPDECDISSGASLDCNGNNVPDECDVAAGTSLDCNGNGLPDECDLSSGASIDLNGDTVPDECQDFVRGDANESGTVDLSDALTILDYLVGGSTSSCLDAYDTDDDGQVNIVDPIYLLSFLFQMGSAPPAPFGGCGPDMTLTDGLGCGGDFGACP
ncbi:MAG: dockerin type I repeat-containing protein [Planctomycetes bacterium]|nr:dockerin type I repeat-containing protein [Planctomycetota bacterium]